jgi:hypothetical protein
MGAPCSHQRRWADYEFFERFRSTSRSPGRAQDTVLGTFYKLDPIPTVVVSSRSLLKGPLPDFLDGTRKSHRYGCESCLDRTAWACCSDVRFT